MDAMRTYTFPSRQQLGNFMNLINSFTGWSLDGFYPNLDKPQSGSMKVYQALPYLVVAVEWKTSGGSVTFNMSYVETHLDPFRRQQVYDHLRRLANWQGAGLS